MKCPGTEFSKIMKLRLLRSGDVKAELVRMKKRKPGSMQFSITGMLPQHIWWWCGKRCFERLATGFDNMGFLGVLLVIHDVISRFHIDIYKLTGITSSIPNTGCSHSYVTTRSMTPQRAGLETCAVCKFWKFVFELYPVLPGRNCMQRDSGVASDFLCRNASHCIAGITSRYLRDVKNLYLGRTLGCKEMEAIIQDGNYKTNCLEISSILAPIGTRNKAFDQPNATLSTGNADEEHGMAVDGPEVLGGTATALIREGESIENIRSSEGSSTKEGDNEDNDVGNAQTIEDGGEGRYGDGELADVFYGDTSELRDEHVRICYELACSDLVYMVL